MKQYKKYHILSQDRFEAGYFSAVSEEVNQINEMSKNLPQAFKAEIIIAYAIGHSLQNDWVSANPGLTALVTSGTLLTGNIESLFDCCSDNQSFREGFEDYLRKSLT